MTQLGPAIKAYQEREKESAASEPAASHRVLVSKAS
jgi:hypothetical protein